MIAGDGFATMDCLDFGFWIWILAAVFVGRAVGLELKLVGSF